MNIGSNDQGNGGELNLYRSAAYGLSAGAQALGEWLEASIGEGYLVYYLNFMFEAFPGPRDAVLHQQRKAIHRGFYAPLCQLSARHPRAPSERHRLPEAILFPDLPVFKATGGALLHGNANGGFHYNGWLRIPATSRFDQRLDLYVQSNAKVLRRHGIARVHVVPVHGTPAHLADYVTKTVKRGLVDLDQVYVLPLSSAELRPQTKPTSLYQKAIRDIESLVNCSRELAEQLYRSP